MVSITNIQQLAGPLAGNPRENVAPQASQGTVRSPRDPETRPADEAVAKEQPVVQEAPRVPDYLDPSRVEAYLSRVAEAIRKAADGPHVVGFRLDPDSGVYVVEVKDRDGELVTTLSPQKTLNRPVNPDEPTGMLVDHLS